MTETRPQSKLWAPDSAQRVRIPGLLFDQVGSRGPTLRGASHLPSNLCALLFRIRRPLLGGSVQVLFRVRVKTTSDQPPPPANGVVISAMTQLKA